MGVAPSTGVRGTICIFIVAALVTEVLFEWFLIHTVVLRVKYSCQRFVMDTSLSDITGRISTIITFDAKHVCSPDNNITHEKSKTNIQIN